MVVVMSSSSKESWAEWSNSSSWHYIYFLLLSLPHFIVLFSILSTQENINLYRNSIKTLMSKITLSWSRCCAISGEIESWFKYTRSCVLNQSRLRSKHTTILRKDIIFVLIKTVDSNAMLQASLCVDLKSNSMLGTELS